MKIGIDITQAQYQGTGVGTYTLSLVKALLDLDFNNYYLLFGGSLRGFGNLKKIATTLPAPEKKLYPLPPLALDLIFNRLHSVPIETFTGYLDIFHASDWTHPPTTNAKTVTTVHDLTTIKFPQNQPPKNIATHQRRLHWAVREAAAIITDSQATKRDLIELFPQSEPRITTIYLAPRDGVTAFARLSHPQKHRRIDQIKTKYHLHNEYILSLGTNEPRKNLLRTVKAYTQSDLVEDLVIAGRFGWGSKVKPAPSIKVLGLVGDQDLPALIAGASCFVYPSLYEGFGLPVLEAMALGVPTVTTNQGSLKEIAGQAAVSVDPYHTASITAGIKKALLNPKLYQDEGLKQARKFSWPQTAAQTLAIYEQVYQTAN